MERINGLLRILLFALSLAQLAFMLVHHQRSKENEWTNPVQHASMMPSAPQKPFQTTSNNATLTQSVVGNPQPSALNATGDVFCACLIIKDNNHWLTEWLAYHYHVLPLRHLIIVVDPDSTTSPKPILDRWKGRMIIEDWSDRQMIPPDVVAKHQNESTLWFYSRRQEYMMLKSMQYFKGLGYRWMLATDVDEFIHVNHRVVQMPLEAIGLQGYVTTVMQHAPPFECYHLPRIQVSSKAANDNPLLTVAYPHYQDRSMSFGKTFVDLQMIQTMPERIINVHRLYDACLTNWKDRREHPSSLFVAMHYFGRLEQFTFRQDPRLQADVPSDRTRNYTRWELYFCGGRGAPQRTDPTMSQWVKHFYRNVEDAAFLLQDAGVVQEPSQERLAAARRAQHTSPAVCET